MSKEPELHLWLRPTHGEPLTIRTRSFGSAEEALAKLSGAIEHGYPVSCELSGPDDAEGAVVLINPAAVAAVKVWPEPAGETGDGSYL
ncbi:hypothetical protein [Streptomyces indicus]|uniref:Uncharacterized protein n=1 Tax=Streptomyces indicus TaxID=417292 RepID=A0A1G8TB02_9ACTN|nr:hypothetical protein [Streptomyces indicus]SDJ38671.1 hypothetical protein SAMN05421806_101156 [Streptomyces indicus]